MAEKGPVTVLQLHCACRKVDGSVTVLVSLLPLSFSLCHCNTCRHQSGLLCTSYLTLPAGTSHSNWKGPITKYASSDRVIRAFCSNCGANIYFHDSNDPTPSICTGVLEGGDRVMYLDKHIFVPETKDGGFSHWMTDLPAWEGYSHQSKQWEIGLQRQVKVQNTKSPELQAFCHCKGVQFKITPPNQHSKHLSAPYPDLLLSDVADSTLVNNEDSKWWLPGEGKKYLAGTCACKTCRLSSGFDVQFWCFVPLVNLVQMNGDPLELRMGSLGQYESSKGIYRHFCDRCGATVFWRSDSRPHLIDVSVGLLDAEEGARAESWLEWWTGRVSFEEEAQNKDLISRLGVGLRRWGSKETPASA